MGFVNDIRHRDEKNRNIIRKGHPPMTDISVISLMMEDGMTGVCDIFLGKCSGLCERSSGRRALLTTPAPPIRLYHI